jgi:hypothetical protein
MLVPNDEWTLVGAGSDPKLVVQNTGSCRIGFVIVAAPPAVDAYDLAAGGEIGQLLPGMDPLTVTGLDADGKNMYVRALGPIDGELFVYDPAE